MIIMVYNANARRNHVNESYFKNIDTTEKAYWLGFIQADGCIWEQDTTYRFQINLSGKDKEHLIAFNEHIKSTYKVSVKNTTVKGKVYETCSLKINSKPFCESLMKHGIEVRKSLNDYFPSLDSELMRHYIRGFFDGDGGIKIDKRGNTKRSVISFVGGQGFLTKLAHYLESVGIQPSDRAIEKNSKSEAHMLTLSSKENIIKLYEYMYKEQTVCLPRKLEKYHQVLARYEYSPLTA